MEGHDSGLHRFHDGSRHRGFRRQQWWPEHLGYSLASQPLSQRRSGDADVANSKLVDAEQEQRLEFGRQREDGFSDQARHHPDRRKPRPRSHLRCVQAEGQEADDLATCCRRASSTRTARPARTSPRRSNTRSRRSRPTISARRQLRSRPMAATNVMPQPNTNGAPHGAKRYGRSVPERPGSKRREGHRSVESRHPDHRRTGLPTGVLDTRVPGAGTLELVRSRCRGRTSATTTTPAT